jgi:hypothetical protein
LPPRLSGSRGRRSPDRRQERRRSPLVCRLWCSIAPGCPSFIAFADAHHPNGSGVSRKIIIHLALTQKPHGQIASCRKSTPTGIPQCPYL